MTKYTNPAIIIGGGSSNGLGIARNLGSLGINVYCFSSNPYELTRTSKYCKGFALVPEIEANKDKLREVLRHFETNLNEKGVLFPTTDTSVLTLSSIIDELDSYVTYIPNRKNVETCVLKKNFYKSLKAQDVPHPSTHYPNEENIEEIIPKLEFPVYIRPSQSQVFASVFGKKGFVANTPKELQKYVQMTQAHNIDVMVQEIIPGPSTSGYTFRGFIDKKSRLVALMADQKIRQPSMFSNVSIQRSIPLSHVSKAKESLIKYLQAVKYQGLFMAEFKKDSRDNVFKLLEINARSAGSNYFPVYCGMNHVLRAYLDAIGEEIYPVTDYELDVYKISILADIPILLNKLVHEKVSYQDIYMYFRKIHWQVFSKDDVLPFFTNIQKVLDNNGFQKLIMLSRARPDTIEENSEGSGTRSRCRTICS